MWYLRALSLEKSSGRTSRDQLAMLVTLVVEEQRIRALGLRGFCSVEVTILSTIFRIRYRIIIVNSSFITHQLPHFMTAKRYTA